MSNSDNSRRDHSEPTNLRNSGRESDDDAEQPSRNEGQTSSVNAQDASPSDLMDTIEHPRNEGNNDTEDLKGRVADRNQRNRGIPKEFGRYRIEKVLGRGGMGSVYLAHDTQLDRQVALKVPSFGTDDPNLVERFYREARAAATLNHPNLCPVHDVGVIGGTHFLTMAYIRGKTLSAFVRQGGLPANQVAALIRKIALAIHEAHRKGVIHRDLKPDNIMIDSRRQPVVMDFGLAQRTGSGDARITHAGSFFGTPAYMSPEQISDAGTVGPASDVFSLGIITYELLVGERPFSGKDAISTIGAILTNQPASPKKWSVELDSEIEAICLRSLEKNVKDRYASMGEFADALGEYLKGTRVSSTGQSADSDEIDANAPSSPGEETLVAEMFKGISLSQVSGTVNRRATSQKRSNKTLLAAGALLVALVLLIPWLALRDWSGSASVSGPTSVASPALESEMQINDRSRPESSPAKVIRNRSLLAPLPNSDRVDGEPDSANPAAGFGPTELKGLGGEERVVEDATRRTAGPETRLQSAPVPLPVPHIEAPASFGEGLIAHFPMDESEGGEAANAVAGEPGGIYVGPSTPNWVSGVIGNAVRLTNGYFDCGKGFNPAQNSAFSFGCWFYADRPQFAALIAKTDEANRYRGFELYLGREEISLHLHNGLVRGNDSDALTSVADSKSLAGGWHYAFATYDGSSKADGTRLYLDGRIAGQITNDSLTGTLQNDVSLHIGRRSKQSQFQGRIDDVRIYDRCLEPQEVEQLYLYGVQSVEKIAVDERTADQADLVRRFSIAKENDSENETEVKEEVSARQVATPETRMQRRPARLPTTLRRGLLAHFPLDESEGRETANAVPRQPGGFYIGPGQPSWVSGVIGNAAHLTDGYFDCGKNINPTQYNAFSLGCWYYSDGPQYAALIAKIDETNSYRGFELYLHRPDPRQTNNPLPERLSINLMHQGGSGISRAVDIGSLENGWHHAFATYDGSSKAQGARLYLDGRMVGVLEADSLSGTLQNNVSLLIGRRSIRDRYRGRIDDVRIYNRSLRPQEVEQLFLYGVRSVENVPVDEQTVDQAALLRRFKSASEN